MNNKVMTIAVSSHATLSAAEAGLRKAIKRGESNPRIDHQKESHVTRERFFVLVDRKRGFWYKDQVMNIAWVRAEEDMMNPEYDAPRCAQCNEPYRHDSVSTEENLCSMKCAAIWLKDCGECYICGGTCTVTRTP